MSGLITAAVIGAGSAYYSSEQAGSAARKAGARSEKLLRLQEKQADRRDGIANQLEEMAAKMLRGEPISEAEKALFATVEKATNMSIQKNTEEATRGALQAQAGTGFLKSTRMADQVRKIHLEGSEQKTRAAIQREQAMLNMANQKQQQGISLLQSAAGMPIPQFQSNLIDTSGLTTAAGIGAVGGVVSGYANQYAQNQQNAALIEAMQSRGNTNGVPANNAGWSVTPGTPATDYTFANTDVFKYGRE